MYFVIQLPIVQEDEGRSRLVATFGKEEDAWRYVEKLGSGDYYNEGDFVVAKPIQKLGPFV